MTKTRRAAAVLGAAAAAVALGASAAYAATSVSVDPTATISGAGTRVTVTGTATCDPNPTNPDARGTVVVSLNQNVGTPLFAAGQGTQLVVCDSAPHTFAVTVAGGVFRPGPATYSVLLRGALVGQTASANGTVTLI